MSKTHTLYMADVTEHEYEAGWGVNVRPDGRAFAEDKDTLIEYFATRGRSPDLYETINTPKLVRVNNLCYKHFTIYKEKHGEVVWLRGKSLEVFIEGVEQ